MTQKSGHWAFFFLFAIYLLLCFAFLVAPGRSAFLLPLMGALVIAVAWFMGSGVSTLLILVASLVCLGTGNQWPVPQRLFLSLGILQLWAIGFLIHVLDQRSFRWRYEQEKAKYLWKKKCGELRREMGFYRRHLGDMKSKSFRRQELASCARDLGAGLDVTEIQGRLLKWSKQFFPDAQCVLAGLTPNDPVDAWVDQRRQAVLCDDLPNDQRFQTSHVEPGTRSLMMAPLWVENKIFGGLRVESPTPQRFSRSELRELDALTTLASLALDNAVLYHRIQDLAVRDGLTQLLTHRAFEERLAEELLRAARYHYPVSLVMMDVDHFKRINDTYGHAAGDEVLRRVSRRLAEACRPVDAAARYGGEEFSLVLVEWDHAKAVELAETFRKTVAQEIFQFLHHQPVKVTVSLGVAVYPEEALTSSQLIRLADQRLYQAKSQGRNRTVGSGS